jgi:glycerol-1-phosphate dehydrogenase [NAD(P)+]
MTAFNKAKNMDFPRSVRIGHDKILESGDICKDLQFGKIGTIITGDATYRAAGRTVEDLIKESRFEVHVFKTDNATLENVDAAIAACKENRSKFIVAVGGGSKIDIAKITAAKLKVPFISIPTSVAHDGIASDRASLKLDKGAKSIAAVSPLGIIADSAIINEAPYRYLAAGCADVISNLTALKDWDFAVKMRNVEFSSSAYYISKFAAENLIDNAQLIKPHFEESVWMVMRPIIASGVSMCIAGSSRPTSGSEHMFSHALDLIHPNGALHGEQCGIGTIMMMKLHGDNWQRIRYALETIGAPTTAKQLGIPEQHIIDALVAAKDIRKDRFTILGDWGLTEEAAENLARSTGVI